MSRYSDYLAHPEMGSALSWPKGAGIGVLAPAALALADAEIPPLPAPIDLPAHAGNMTMGGTIALLGAYGYVSWINRKEPQYHFDYDPKFLNPPELSRFRRFGTAAVMAVTAGVNVLTETKWGGQILPNVTQWFNVLGNSEPSVWDGIYATAWSGLMANICWRRARK